MDKDVQILERLKRLDARISREFDAIDARVNWLLTAHAFLFGAFVNLLRERLVPVAGVMLGTTVIGIVSAVLVGIAIRQGMNIVETLLKPLRTELENSCHSKYDQVGASVGSSWHRLGHLPARVLPWLLCGAWTLLFIVVTLRMSHKYFMLTFIVFSVFSLLSLLGVIVFIAYFNKYQRRLKQVHPKEYGELELKDNLVETAGDWIRWPIGSAGPLLAIFNLRSRYGDDVLSTHQNRALIWLCIFLVSFALSLWTLLFIVVTLRMSHKYIMLTFIVFSLLSLLGVIVFIAYFNKYQRRLKQKHPKEYIKLKSKDNLVETAGDWIRWPIGSAGPLLAIFNLRSRYDDDVLSTHQNRALIWLCIFLVSFALSLLSGANL